MDKQESNNEQEKALALQIKLKYGVAQIFTSHLLRLIFSIELN